MSREATASAETALKDRIAGLQKRIDTKVRQMVSDHNRLHPGQTPAALASKPLVVPKPPRGKYALGASLVRALRSLDYATLIRLPALTRSLQAELIGPATVRLANSARGVRLDPKEVSADWLGREMKQPQREKAHAALQEEWKELARINGRRLGRLDTPAKFLDFVVAQRTSSKAGTLPAGEAASTAVLTRRAEDTIWFTDKRTMWFRGAAGESICVTVTWRSRPSATQFRIPGLVKKPSLSTFAKARGYTLEEVIGLSDAAQLAADAAATKKQKDAEAQAEMDESGLFDAEVTSSVEGAPHAA